MTNEIVETDNTDIDTNTDTVSEAVTGAEVVTFDQDLVEKAYADLKNIFVHHAHNAMLEAGQYLVITFYNDSYSDARSGNYKENNGVKSLSQLIKARREDNSKSFSRSWIYNAVKYACAEEKYNSVQTYGQLSPSHKVELFRVKDEEQKESLIVETVQNNYSVRQLRERINELQPKNGQPSIENYTSDADFTTMETKDLQKLQTQGQKKVEKLTKEIEKFQNDLAEYQARLQKIEVSLEESADA